MEVYNALGNQGVDSRLYNLVLLCEAMIVGVRGMLEQVPGIVLCSHGVEHRRGGGAHSA